jgi:hypothetical protein
MLQERFPGLKSQIKELKIRCKALCYLLEIGIKDTLNYFPVEVCSCSFDPMRDGNNVHHTNIIRIVPVSHSCHQIHYEMIQIRFW